MKRIFTGSTHLNCVIRCSNWLTDIFTDNETNATDNLGLGSLKTRYSLNLTQL
jgi:hypothetical protein